LNTGKFEIGRRKFRNSEILKFQIGLGLISTWLVSDPLPVASLQRLSPSVRGTLAIAKGTAFQWFDILID
jgi:hypothetical protein